ncbi:glycosyltransferase family 9 protein [Vibrio cholerae]|nr:ADP-heptose--LPS heptosyltransferase I [Vibrio cholerae]EGR0603385.1 glycosyltransferase family 9 protein [Vibrio cholerae]EGR3933396.1 lipopolysaccharide heptosyltransferase family protein [Vibrio cholerae]EKA3900698.1 glycosyltransferase family 9 protein [Vibrio cholerae]
MSLFDSAPKSLCILRLSAIGDVCHAIAVVQAIQAQWPETQITWICGKIESQLIADLPGIRVVTFDKKQGMAGMRAVWSEMKHERFDVLLHMQAALRASLLSLGLKARYKVGFGKNRTREGQWWFTNRHLPKTDAVHVLDNFSEFARYLGISFHKPHWNIPLSDSDQEFAIKALQDAPSLVICPAASKDCRNWLVERYAAVADFATENGLQVVLCGSPAEREIQLGQAIINQCVHPVVNLIGQTSLKQLTAVLKQAHIVIAPDSGPAHLATTQGTPVIGLYAHSNPLRTGPYYSLETTVNAYQRLAEQQFHQPASNLKWGTRLKGENLMSTIQVEEVTRLLLPFCQKSNL